MTCSSGRASCRCGRWPRSSSTPAARPRRCCCPTCSTWSCRGGYYSDGRQAAAPLGPRPGRRQRRRGVLQRGLAPRAGRDLRRRPARGAVARRRRPLGGRDGRPARRPDRHLVGRRRHRRHGRDPRRHPGRRDDRRPRRDDPAPGPQPARLVLGPPARPRARERHRGPVRPRAGALAGQPRAAGSSAAAARPSTPRRGTPSTGTAWSTCRRCGWWCRWATSTGRAGST